MESSALKQELNCTICLSLYTEPVTLSCGHTYCQQCIQQAWANQGDPHLSCCPECIATNKMGTELNKNIKMCNMVNYLNSLQEKEDGKNKCNYCEEAAKMLCVMCEAYLCDLHLESHKSVDHVLIDLSISLESRKCQIHLELLKYYCYEDCEYVCASCCLFGEHKGHNVQALNDIFKNEKLILQSVVKQLTIKQNETDRNMEKAKEQQNSAKQNTQCVKNKVTGIFTDIKKELEVLEHQILHEFTIQEDEAESQFVKVIQQLREKKSKVNKTTINIETLCNMTDPITVLEKRHIEIQNANALLLSEDNSDLKELDELLIMVNLQSGLNRILRHIHDLQKKKVFHIQNAHITLDVNSVSPPMVFTKHMSNTSTFYQKKIGQNGQYCQALSPKAFSLGQHYWEVETSEMPRWGLGVSYQGIAMETQCVLGYNSSSWCFYMSDVGKYKAVHNSVEVIVPTLNPLKVLGVYLDCQGGRLSFYQVTDSVKHLYTFSTSFCEPVYAAFHLNHIGWLRIRH
ncbi:E3 ubiquitin/ISG15 ligase TRIM25-like [Bombina bombina]|uniref:E3 ubiquitin/ISG15 ligase TRIM25-like n=1 Tax=Bombina bombina TaxID=8345 RepID=UPI00235AF69B|nr:E3 ubiquitin/ISG15 ligase TRIM25-like [Bombina bombina]